MTKPIVIMRIPDVKRKGLPVRKGIEAVMARRGYFELCIMKARRSSDPPPAVEDDEVDRDGVWAVINVLADSDPFPGFTLSGQELVWMKTYAENKGLLDVLVSIRCISEVSRSLKQGLATLQMIRIDLDEEEIVHQCSKCKRFEFADQLEETRFKPCTKCMVVYYCSPEHQERDWEGDHHKYCTFLSEKRFAQVENQRRKEQGDAVFENRG